MLFVSANGASSATSTGRASSARGGDRRCGRAASHGRKQQDGKERDRVVGAHRGRGWRAIDALGLRAPRRAAAPTRARIRATRPRVRRFALAGVCRAGTLRGSTPRVGLPPCTSKFARAAPSTRRRPGTAPASRRRAGGRRIAASVVVTAASDRCGSPGRRASPVSDRAPRDRSDRVARGAGADPVAGPRSTPRIAPGLGLVLDAARTSRAASVRPIRTP